ncbi:hypothetical protein [Nitrospira sp. BLG_1]
MRFSQEFRPLTQNIDGRTALSPATQLRTTFPSSDRRAHPHNEIGLP